MTEPASGEPSPPGPHRADARRNRELLLAAAMDAFAEHGVDVQMGQIARRAGLATGTVYRHFPTKEALVDALLISRLDLVAQAAWDARAQPDPWTALEGFTRKVTALQLEHRELAQFIGGRIRGSPELQERLAATFEVFTALVARARQAGQLRAGIDANDIRATVICIARAAAADWPGPGWILDRYLSVVLDGLHAPGRTRLAGAPPPADELGRPAAPATPTAFRRGRRGWPT
jgi:AcrR family transcriptional regulator